MISKEDKKDVARVMGGKTANKVASATNDARNKAIHAKTQEKYTYIKDDKGKTLNRYKAQPKRFRFRERDDYLLTNTYGHGLHDSGLSRKVLIKKTKEARKDFGSDDY